MTMSGNSAVNVTVNGLVSLSRQASLIPLQSKKIHARQSGEYRSPFKGRGMEFDESRLYQPGDDIRNIDWRVTARTGTTHTKLFREERERPVFVWLDLRASMFFATQGRYKAVIAAELAGLLSWSALQHGDRVGGLVFSDTEHHETKPARGKAAVLRLINHIVHHPGWTGKSSHGSDTRSLEQSLIRLRRVARPGSMIFLLSDFRGFSDAARIQLSRLCKHNEIVMLFIYDQLESSLPPAGRYRVTDGHEEFLLDTYDNGLVETYQTQFRQRREELESFARMNKVRLIPAMTRDDPFVMLTRELGVARVK